MLYCVYPSALWVVCITTSIDSYRTVKVCYYADNQYEVFLENKSLILMMEMTPTL